jgi:hypothetical protein
MNKGILNINKGRNKKQVKLNLFTALIALCVVLLPVIIPVAAVGGTGYLAYAGIKKGANVINKKQRNKKRNSDIIKTQMVFDRGREKGRGYLKKFRIRKGQIPQN